MAKRAAGNTLSVLHVNDNVSWRGGERQTFLLVRGLGDYGIESCLACRPRSALARRAREAGLDMITAGMRGEWDLFSILRIRALVRARGFAIVHAHTAHAHGLCAWALAGLPDVKLAVTRRVDRRRGRGIFSSMKYRRCDRFIAISETIRANLLADGIPNAAITRIYSGIDVASAAGRRDRIDARAELGLTGTGLVAGTVAAMTPEKDHPTLLRAARIVLGAHPGTRFVLIGDGPCRGALERQARALGIAQQVVFTGERADAERMLPDFDLFVLPSKSEGLGSSVLDAMAGGVPVVVSRTGGLVEIVSDGESGMLFTPGDSGALASCLCSLLDDPGQRERLAKAGRARAGEFDISKSIASTALLYGEMCGRGASIDNARPGDAAPCES
ncbi:MAG: glycosyltransferase [Chitinivibrionales bacterium]|nr:glycosyltransferase [Chitinivibrionales bacterium]MBD3397401.1 glycosyltransferase [Chitinivibrionales bacterium]